ncbi:RNA methyltransferase [Roseisolibacter sp. H3M3-2]|uniref:TrmH family RNA methyltransferase n=1 Tax=Roseisolibacter sp. H3M3-2 TaxID=3031323 RepID=UPI0023DB0004|nr:RNA methyltransferase [Roseisolibacter sp. H3M3-2]MDF1501902.1 RNA methyltransferase [Roseisolibacter sp. H3M3-2]
MRLLTLARDLQRRKARERQRLFVAEGIRTVEELLDAPHLSLRGAVVSPLLAATPRGAALRSRLDAAGAPVLEATERDFDSAAGTDSPQGVLAIAEQPALALDALGDRLAGRPARLLLLDGVQDPGNVGTLLRSAAGLGADAVVALGGTVDLWSAKVVRSAMGALFRLSTLGDTADAVLPFLAAQRIVLWGADGTGTPVAELASDAPDRLAVAVGNEGAGLSTPVRECAARLVAVPSSGLVESLNVAVAASILLYELRPAALRAPR